MQRSVHTDVQGSYEMLGLGGARRRDIGDLRVRAAGYGNERKILDNEELTEDTRLDFVLHPARVASGRVVDTDGAPIEGVYVAGVAPRRSRTYPAQTGSRPSRDPTVGSNWPACTL